MFNLKNSKKRNSFIYKMAATSLGLTLSLAGLSLVSAQNDQPTPSSSSAKSGEQAQITKAQTTPQKSKAVGYAVSTLDDLKALRELFKRGETFEGKIIVLKNDIHITSNEKVDGDMIDFDPIFCLKYKRGVATLFDEKTGFKGTFDGNGKTINCKTSGDHIFGNVAEGGIVKNLNFTGIFEGNIDSPFVYCNRGTIDNVKINMLAKDTYISLSGLCDYNMNGGLINNCEVRGELYTKDMACAGICSNNEGGSITNCNVFAKLNNCYECLIAPEDEEDFGYRFQLPETGGISSFNTGLISNCYVETDLLNLFEGKLYGSAGGLVSTNNGLVEDSTFKGTVAGTCVAGAISGNYAIIKSCQIIANVIGIEAAEFAHHNVWGEIGYAWKEIKELPQGVIDNCVFNGSVKASEIKGDAAVINAHNPYGDKPQITNCKINGKDVVRNVEYNEDYSALPTSATLGTMTSKKTK